MIIFASILILIICSFIGKVIFKSWFNHLFIYAFSWVAFAILYEIGLIRYTPITTETWVIVLATFLSFCFGIMTVYLARDLFQLNIDNPHTVKNFDIVFDNGRILKYSILLFALLGLIGSLQHWVALISKFGSIPAVLVQANKVYRLKVHGEDYGQIPYLYTFAYASIFLSAVYSAYKNKISAFAILPFTGVILKDLSSFARAGIFFSFVLFIVTFIVTRFALSAMDKNKYQKNGKMIFTLIIVIVLAVSSVTFIKMMRSPLEEFKAASSSLRSLKEGSVISPTIYLYFSSNIAVLSKYFEGDGEDTMFGEHTFLPVYNLMSKFDFVEHPDFFPKGYFVPMWTNSATYLRELHADFGYFGLFIIPYLLGLFTTFYWFKFFKTYRVFHLFILIYLMVIVSFSVFYMVTRLAMWFLSFIILMIYIPIIIRYLKVRYSNK